MFRIALLAIAALLGMVGCGADDEKAKTEEGTPVADAGQVKGEWTLESVALRENKDQAIVNSGFFTARIRANGTIYMAFEGFNLSGGNLRPYVSCSGFRSGKIRVESGTAIFSDYVMGATSGTCEGVDAAPAIKTLPDISSKMAMAGDKLQVSLDFTYVDATGASKMDALVYTFKKKGDETWDGSGLDPAFLGTWRLSKVYSDVLCDPKSAGEANYTTRGELTVGGTVTTTISAAGYQQVLTDFALGSGDKCSGTTVGTLSPTMLGMGQTETSATAECASDKDPEGYVELLNRDGTADTKWVQFLAYKVPDEDCAGGVLQAALIGVNERQ